MFINKVYLENFRNYEKQEIEFSEKANVIYGLNGQGKTNIVEALYFFCRGKSYRTPRDADVIKFGEKYSRFSIDFNDDVRDSNAEIYIGEKKNIKINSVPIEKLSELVGMINTVIFTPDMLGVVKDGPGVRRQFADVLLSQIKPVYFRTLLMYCKVLFQRNNILKSRKKNMLATLPVWNEKLAEYGTLICSYRVRLTEMLTEHTSKFDCGGEDERILFDYRPSIRGDFSDRENFISQLEANIDREIEKGITLTGPHRDDIEIMFGGRDLKKFGSQGQIRTCILKMKLAECDIIRESVGREPILLLDDILSELDADRRDFFLNNIKDRQIFITSTEKEIIRDSNTGYFHVECGKIVE